MCREAEALAKEVVWREARGTSAGARSQTIDIEQNVAMGCVAFRRCEGLKSLGSSVAPCSQDGGMEGEDRGDDGARHDDLRHRGRGAQNHAARATQTKDDKGPSYRTGPLLTALLSRRSARLDLHKTVPELLMNEADQKR